jgi:hypothetical protein
MIKDARSTGRKSGHDCTLQEQKPSCKSSTLDVKLSVQELVKRIKEFMLFEDAMVTFGLYEPTG